MNSIAVSLVMSGNMQIRTPDATIMIQRADIIDLIRAIAVFVTRSYNSL